ncbi:MAG: hypothetical protein JSU92_03920 [Deltaproteobacteria bacterium]|nr:MAG: hypothetical protein JSU92_03920 [Deltaproteobacteria bacterium]
MINLTALEAKLKIKAQALNIMVALGSVVIFFSLAELILRVGGFQFHSGPTYMNFGFPDPNTLHRIFKPDPVLFWTLVPGFNFPGAEIEGVNSLGFRGKEFSVKKREDNIRVICMGCSVTFGEVNSYPQKLQELLNSSEFDRKIEVINAGIPGYSSFQGLRLLKTRLLDLEPDLITVLYGWNDHWLTRGYSDMEQRPLGEDIVEIKNFLDRFRFYQLLNSIQNSIKIELNFRYQRPSGESDTKYRVDLGDYRENLKEIISLSRENGVKIFLLTSPSGAVKGKIPKYLTEMRFVNDPEELIPLHQSYNQVVRELAGDEGVPLIDLTNIFEEKDKGRFFDDPEVEIIHPKENGYQLIAQELYLAIKGQ